MNSDNDSSLLMADESSIRGDQFMSNIKPEISNIVGFDTPCEICFQKLTKKRFIKLDCGHNFHRTCIVAVCESQITAEFFCPVCEADVNFDIIRDDSGRTLSERVFGYGPTKQPTEFLFKQFLENYESFFDMDKLFTRTTNWMHQICSQLKTARKSGDYAHEYIKDIMDERKMLLQRCQIITKLQEDYAAIQYRMLKNIEESRIDNKLPDSSINPFAIEQLVAGDSKTEPHCENCLQVISSKRNTTLKCGHHFHRTCLLRVCESKKWAYRYGQFTCPKCDVVIKYDDITHQRNAVINDDTGRIPRNMFGIGNTIQVAGYLRPESAQTYLEDIFSVTTNWLHQVSAQLFAARKSEDKSDQYIQDIIYERKKLLQRCQNIYQMQEDYALIELRNTKQDAIIVEELSNIEPFDESLTVENNTDELCAICLQNLSNKLSSTIADCGHSYHWTCLVQWIDTQHTEENPTCCTCREIVKSVTDENGQKLGRTYPFELRTQDALLRGRVLYASDEFMISNRVDCTAIILACHKARRLALRDGKSAEYVADIEEEIEKLRIRTVALHTYFFQVLEFKELEGISVLGTEAAPQAVSSERQVGPATDVPTAHVGNPTAVHSDSIDAAIENNEEAAGRIDDGALGAHSDEAIAEPIANHNAASAVDNGAAAPETIDDTVTGTAGTMNQVDPNADIAYISHGSSSSISLRRPADVAESSPIPSKRKRNN